MKKPDTGTMMLLGWRLAAHLPQRFVVSACAAGGVVAWAMHGKGVRRLESNLTRVRPELPPRAIRRLSRAGMVSYLRYFGEALVLQRFTTDQIMARVRMVGDEQLRELLADGQTVVLALGHNANWDLAGAWAVTALAPVTTVAERLEPPELFEHFVSYREALGIQIIPLSASGGGVFGDLMRVARRREPGGRIMPLLADRDLTKGGVKVEMFGVPALVAAGPAALAVSTGAPLAAVGAHYERLHGERRRRARSRWGLVLEISRVVEDPKVGTSVERVAAMTQAWVDDLSARIHEHPQDWHMLQRLFVADLDPARVAHVDEEAQRIAARDATRAASHQDLSPGAETEATGAAS